MTDLERLDWIAGNCAGGSAIRDKKCIHEAIAEIKTLRDRVSILEAEVERWRAYSKSLEWEGYHR